MARIGYCRFCQKSNLNFDDCPEHLERYVFHLEKALGEKKCTAITIKIQRAIKEKTPNSSSCNDDLPLVFSESIPTIKKPIILS